MMGAPYREKHIRSLENPHDPDYNFAEGQAYSQQKKLCVSWKGDS